MIKQFVHSLHPQLEVLEGLPLLVFVIVIALTVAVALIYATQGLRVAWQLQASLWKTRRLMKVGGALPPSQVGNIFRWNPARHLWAEYSDTLHELKKASNGDASVVEVRATTSAEVYFTRDVLVDGRLFDDFIRHVPGVLTGLGIIGTFAGLLDGLANFDPSSTDTAVAGLGPLMQGVQHAFVASATAISCAMGVLFVTRGYLAWLYGLVERLVHSIDSLYSTGAGEEYLSRLVHASEKSEAHAAQLKEALVEDLSTLMTNLTERQIQAQASANQMLGEHLGDAITGSLAEPLKRMTESMELTSRGNGDAVSGMLETMLASFMAKLEDTFGGQMRGLNEQMRESMNAMTAVQSSLRELVEDIGKANKSASDEMSNKLAEAMRESTKNQSMLTEQMQQFVVEFRAMLADEQGKARQTMNESVQEVFSKVSAAVEQLEKIRIQAAADEKARGDHLARESNALIDGLAGNVEELVRAVSAQVAKTQENIDSIGSITAEAISGMNAGAGKIETAAVAFSEVGDAVNKVLERTGKVSGDLQTTAASLQEVSRAINQGTDMYRQQRKSVETYIEMLGKLVKDSESEALSRAKMLEDLKVIVTELQKAERQSKEYFDGVNTALEKAFTSFQFQMDSRVKSAMTDSDRHISNGTMQLVGVVQELERVMKRLSKA